MMFEIVFSDKTKILEGERGITLSLKSSSLTEIKKLLKLDYEYVEKISPEGYLFKKQGLIFGFVMKNWNNNIESTSKNLYNLALKKIGEAYPYRFWNFIPKINDYVNGEEVYKKYNVGRYNAFKGRYADSYQKMLPAATGIDIFTDKFVLIFIAGVKKPLNLQNPNQTPSYEYPKRYGKMPPLFSRATKIKMNGHTILFISGTASIKNHESQFKGDIKKQFDLTVHNLRKIMKISKLKWDKERVKLIIYLRDKNNLNKIKGLISKIDGKNSSFMLANICRKDLDIEIEGWFGDI